MRVRKPVVKRDESDFRSVTDEQKNESQREHGWLEGAFDESDPRPQERAAAGAEQLLGGEVEENGPEQRLRDADAAQNEILPRGLEARGGSGETQQAHEREAA